MVDSSLIPSSYSIPLPLFSRIIFYRGNTKVVNIHLTFIIFFIIAISISLRYISTFPLYVVLVFILYGPILLISLLLHEWGHLWMSRRLLGTTSCRHNNNVILWPFGGYTFCDALSISISSTIEEEEEEDGEEGEQIRGSLRDDIKIAIAGTFMHIPMCIFWFALYAAINKGDVSDFTFRNYLSVISSGYEGFFSTLFKQATLINILLLWFNIFIPSYPLDGGRLITSAMLLVGVALNKAALLTCFVSILVATALLAWSMASFIDGVGITGILTVLLAFFVLAECYRVYKCILGGTLREHPLFGRDCYIYRDIARPSMFQLSSAARNIDTSDTDRMMDEEDEAGNLTMAPTETDCDQVTDID